MEYDDMGKGQRRICFFASGGSTAFYECTVCTFMYIYIYILSLVLTGGRSLTFYHTT